MTPLKVHIISRAQVESLTSTPPIPQADLNTYLNDRPNILSDGFCDIFEKNCRSITQETSFELFEIVDHIDSGTVVVFPFWLELFESYNRSHIATCINWLKATYQSNPVVVQFNHDRDQATVPELQDLPSNFFVLTYNTSRPNATDILLPFWNVDFTREWSPEADRTYRGGFIGHLGGLELRKRMFHAFNGHDGWFMTDTTQIRMDQNAYIEYMRQFDFALCPRGGGLNSYRFFESLAMGCIPVLFADDVELPYPNFPWNDIIVHVVENLAGDFGVIDALLNLVEIKKRRRHIEQVRHLFTLGGVQEFIYRQLKDYLE